MKRIILLICVILGSSSAGLLSQGVQDTSVYLITCGPGTETYSIYGHSALRVEMPHRNIDMVYNWGVFDFSTPNFAYKFARGKLQYMLDSDDFTRFLQIYMFEKRWVQAQKINLTSAEKKYLMELVTENLKPENKKYLYDFFYDDCSTRIRDLLEKVIGTNLRYQPSPDTRREASFRFLTGSYQRPYPWLDLGIDMLMGTPSDKKASDRDRMFLPIEMQKELSRAVVMREGKMVPLLQNPVTVIDFPDPVVKSSLITHPLLVTSLLFIALIILFALVRNRNVIKTADIIIFSVYSILALLMVFTNFITDHQQMKYNLTMLWISPFIPVCLLALILNRDWVIVFRLVFILSLLSFVIVTLFPNIANTAFVPLILIILLRSSARSEFTWNPFTV
ncbi:MAG TPA: DUF4105 domain-containing protein [Bacteroidales bacterium]|mgnify:CR=1 FL=1|nr:DUF4105 domain-containing protein [Bacteroidales bacterium]HPR11209.1 DUF4105 domain-containing protein [Bacteroidales bacterium]